MQVGSVILAVDGLNVSGLSLDAIRGKVSGAPDSRVSIKYRALDGYARDVVLTRASSSMVGADGGRGRRHDSRNSPLSPSQHQSPSSAAFAMSGSGSENRQRTGSSLLASQPSPGRRSPARMMHPARQDCADLGPLQSVLSRRTQSGGVGASSYNSEKLGEKLGVKNLVLF